MGRKKNDGRGRLGGRQKGTPNKTTSTIKEAIAESWRLYQDSGQFQRDIDALDSQSRVVIMEKYAQYISPKMKAVDVDMNVKGSVITIEDELQQLSEENDI